MVLEIRERERTKKKVAQKKNIQSRETMDGEWESGSRFRWQPQWWELHSGQYQKPQKKEIKKKKEKFQSGPISFVEHWD